MPTQIQAPPERLGSFFLGAEYDFDTDEYTHEVVNYDARDLTTHAVCVGMTGSGKTGLCMGLLEEAALDKVPAILIDPKGDITNLMLQFPDLAPQDFQPWINADDARRKGLSLEEYAQATADLWKGGLASWGITSERIRALRDSVDYTIFTPGSDAGIGINILGSLAAPGIDFDTNAEAIRERISGTVAALLGLADINADPVRSREAVLLSNIFEHHWRQNKNLDLAQLILSIQNPPVRQIGVFDVETFYPAKDRFSMAMSFNNLIAAPTFQGWLQGEPLDVDTLFFTAEGTPRHSIFYIAHLSDSERMFFVTLLLENVLSWMRRQSGTTSLRSLLYFDEIFGFFPPVGEPPSKRPLLTLLKQARAFGLGTVLVTQNPVDIDYKGLTNAGTWFIGKLQAERDKARVLEGLKGAIAEAGGTTDIDYDELISRLGSRVFLLHNVHDDGPVVFHTRWAMSYLRGPLTRPQVSQLMALKKAIPAATGAIESKGATSPTPSDAPARQSPPPIPAQSATRSSTPSSGHAPSQPSSEPAIPHGYSATPPGLDLNVEQIYLPADVSERAAIRQLVEEAGNTVEPSQIQLLYEPAILGYGTVRFVDRKRQIDEQILCHLLADAPKRIGGVDWEGATKLGLDVRDLLHEPEMLDPKQGPFFAPAPEEANQARKIKRIEKDLSDWLYYNSGMPILVHERLKLFQRPGEDERSFNMRLQQAARERRDDEVDKLQSRFEKNLDRLEAKLTKEERELSQDESELSSRRHQEWIGIGETVLGAVLGRRRRSLSRISSNRRMTQRARMDIEESHEVIAELKEAIADTQEELETQAREVTMKWAKLMDEVDTEELKPRRTDVKIELVALAWKPLWSIHYTDGRRRDSIVIPAYELNGRLFTDQP
ncbi:MAG: hypothetical protein AAF702_36210 [Chloroflexota bacterium]